MCWASQTNVAAAVQLCKDTKAGTHALTGQAWHRCDSGSRCALFQRYLGQPDVAVRAVQGYCAVLLDPAATKCLSRRSAVCCAQICSSMAVTYGFELKGKLDEAQLKEAWKLVQKELPYARTVIRIVVGEIAFVEDAQVSARAREVSRNQACYAKPVAT